MKKHQLIRIGSLAAGEAFALFSVIRFWPLGEWTRTALAAVTMVLLLLPAAAERLLKRRLRTEVYVLCLLYALGAMMGHSYRFYYYIPWWDGLLHFVGGVMFALVGIQLISLQKSGEKHGLWMTALFGLCFSMAISLLWEFFEYAMDSFFGMDMQNDSLVHAITSYQLGPGPGMLGHTGSIREVVIDGQSLGLNGYLDIGLHDTMSDTLLESAGAMLAAAGFLIGKGRRSVFLPYPTGEEACFAELSEGAAL